MAVDYPLHVHQVAGIFTYCQRHAGLVPCPPLVYGGEYGVHPSYNRQIPLPDRRIGKQWRWIYGGKFVGKLFYVALRLMILEAFEIDALGGQATVKFT